MGKQDKMSSKFDRRSFLTHSAATIGGVAMAGTVADESSPIPRAPPWVSVPRSQNWEEPLP